ncbi:MAG: hypothetical protein HKN82_10520 [Akkermansiaceae bacterium]|nr:hypothetical protein [Akkermansiaceae bacterium]
MNMMSILLGATGLLLVAALVLSFGSMNEGAGSAASQAEVAELRREIARLTAAEDELRQLQRQQFPPGGLAPAGAAVPAPAAVPGPDAAAIEEANRIAALAAENTALQNENEELREEVASTGKKAEIYKDEAGLIAQREIEKHDLDQRRARVIREALLIARLTEWSKEDGFAVITIERSENVQEGSTLAVRRNSGIIGQLRVSALYESGQAVADPIAATFVGGGIDLEVGDELIIPPM